MGRIFSRIAIVAATFLAWQFAANSNQLVRLFVSSPSAILVYASEHTELLRDAFWVTTIESLAGLALALAFALLMGTLVSISPRMANWVLPPMILSQVVPLITIAPLLIVIFGLGIKSKIIMAAIISFFPIFINLAVSIRDIPTRIVDMITLYRPSWKFKAVQIYFPLSMPALMASLRIAATLAVIGAIVAEFTGADVGVGKNLFLAARRLEPELMMASVLLAVILGGGLYLLIVLIERVWGRWYLP